MSIKRLIPPLFILWAKRYLRVRADKRKKYIFSSKKVFDLTFSEQIVLRQEIKKKENFENKLANIQLGIDAIHNIQIQPGEVFSFWKLVRKPTKSNGYKKSRTIIDGVLKEDIGGGLCQLSGILYHGALLAGLEIIERHNHSVDLYQEHERFTPLGADATIVWGHKDLRFKNCLETPLIIHLRIDEEELQLFLSSRDKIIPKKVCFKSEKNTDNILVRTFLDKKLIQESHYMKLQK